VIHGTSMIFSMTDAQGRQGGSSDIRVVGLSDDSTCLSNSSPSSTSASPSPTASTSPSSNSTSGPSALPTTPPPHGISIAAIAGTVIASLLFLAVIITLGLFLLKKYTSQTSGKVKRLPRTLESEIDLSFDSRQTPSVPRNYDPDLAPRHYPNANPSLDANPFQDPPSQLTHYQIPSQIQHPGTFQSPSQHHPSDSGYTLEDPFPTDSSLPYLSGTENELTPPQLAPSTSTSQRKAAMTGVKAYKPSRFIVHTDADDDLPQPNHDGVIELPPQYSEHRRMSGVANPTPDSNAGHLSGSFPS
jgi:hypothetical protein